MESMINELVLLRLLLQLHLASPTTMLLEQPQRRLQPSATVLEQRGAERARTEATIARWPGWRALQQATFEPTASAASECRKAQARPRNTAGAGAARGALLTAERVAFEQRYLGPMSRLGYPAGDHESNVSIRLSVLPNKSYTI